MSNPCARLAVISLLVGACGGGETITSSTPPTSTSADINIVSGASAKGSSAFSPNPKSVSLSGSATATIRWVNRDNSSDPYGSTAVTHRIVSNDGAFDTGELGQNGTKSVSLTAGTYAYHCSIHPSMVGAVTVSAGQ